MTLQVYQVGFEDLAGITPSSEQSSFVAETSTMQSGFKPRVSGMYPLSDTIEVVVIVVENFVIGIAHSLCWQHQSSPVGEACYISCAYPRFPGILSWNC